MQRHRRRLSVWISIIFVISLFTGCGREVESIQAVNPLSKQMLSLPIEGSNAVTDTLEDYGYMTFDSDLSLEKMLSVVRSDSSLRSELIYESIYILSEGQTANHCFCIRSLGSRRFVFTGMRGVLATDIDSSGQKQCRAFLLPVHLISDTSLMSENVQPNCFLYVNVLYEAYDGIEAFYDFYQELGWYTVERDDDSLILSGYRDGVEVIPDASDVSAISCGTLSFELPLIIRFREIEGHHFFTISVDQ